MQHDEQYDDAVEQTEGTIGQGPRDTVSATVQHMAAAKKSGARPAASASSKQRTSTAAKGTARNGATKQPAATTARRVPSRGGRQALVEAVLEELAVKGPANIFPNDISTGLGLSKSLVNFHFGDRDGLIAEAIATGYERYVDELWKAAEAAGPDPIDRLTAWIDRQVEWTITNVGLAAALNFPNEAAALGGVDNPDVLARISAAGARNFSNLQSLVAAARTKLHGKVSGVQVGLDAAVIGWTTLGMSVWMAGRHLPTRELGLDRYLAAGRTHVHAMVAELLER